ncbi:anaerobic glycerol-3-phosphate dehydrogenase subunit C [Anaerolineales bacterium HSG24]|nr:anaerobic glycerol-3-phosphate dehydrogenase subunit C [Anaerolineales bacterium HSG24]
MTTSHDLDEITLSIWEQVQHSADLCVKCNICTSFCPVANVTDMFPGPKFVGPQAQRFRNPHEISVDDSLDYCSGCGVCSMVCPHGVKVMEMNAKARYKLYKTKKWIPLRNRILGRSELLGWLGSPFAPIANVTLKLKPLRILIEGIMGVHRDAPMPAFSWETFRGWYQTVHKKSPQRVISDKKVVFYHACSVNYYEAFIGKAAIAVLEHNGYEVIVPKDQVCCGLPMLSNAEFDAARQNARTNINSLVRYARAGHKIVGTSSSCTLSLKSDYRHILDMDDADARLVSQQTYDICEFLLELAQAGELKTDFQPINASIPYHSPCQLRAHNMGLPAIELMELIPGIQIKHIQADCCGIAGTYGYKKEKHDISMAVGKSLFEQVKATESDVAICDSETCRWQIEHATGTKMIHPVQLLAQAYGLT